MAGETRNVERRDIKMGRSKFPGRPGKALNRRRVNLSSCALPQHNDSSDAAEKIWLGLSVFNETFGDSALSSSFNFTGFSKEDVEEAMMEARLQQREAETELKKQGIKVNLWSDFQAEFSSIEQNIPAKTAQPPKKTSVCFDGGGKSSSVNNNLNVENGSESKKCDLKSSGINTNSEDGGKLSLTKAKNVLRTTALKNLQRQVAKRLLQKAKKVNIQEGGKSSLEKKFVLPSRSAHSSRVIKPTKRFLEDGGARRSRSNTVKESRRKDAQPLEQPKTTVAAPPRASTKVILREARLQLDSSPSSLGEGPFSSPSASSLVPNQHRVSTVVCGVCGAVRFYKFVRQARKFGILTCEPCRKFIAKTIRRRATLLETGIKCLKGTGLCMVPAVVRNAQWSSHSVAYSARCKACWLKLCLRRFHMPVRLKQRLQVLLPPEMRTDSALPTLSDTNHFPLPDDRVSYFNSFIGVSEKPNVASTSKELKPAEEKSRSGRSSKKEKTGKRRGEGKSKQRQRVPLGGPRVKHVCRSASVALGQPIATFVEKPTAEECCDTAPKPVPPPPPPPVIDTKTTKSPPLPPPPVEKIKATIANERQPGPIQQGRKKKNESSADNLISMDFWESYDPEEINEKGFSLIGSQPFTVRALCFLCGSAGLEKLIHCACCCEPYHEFCVSDSQVKTDNWRYDWVCPRCTLCVTCGRASGQQLKCVRCENSYHTECVGGRLLHSPDRPWVCSACLRCKSCNAVDVSIFVGNLPLCKPCFVLRQKGNYCPLCQRCYEDDDYDCKMMECGGCKSWVHAKCEGISDEKYQVLSFLPESVEFICRMCCAMPPAPWWLAVEAELRAGYLGVLKSLSRNRTACRMLRWSPRKVCSCRRRESLKIHSEDDSMDGERRDSPAPTSDSGMGSADDELRLQPDEEGCFCFLEVDSYNSRSKPFSPNLLSIKKKVTTSEYSSLTQFHEDMRSMVETTQSEELMDVYYGALKEVFPWFDPKGVRILGASRNGSLENTPVKSSPVKSSITMPSLVPVASFAGQNKQYFYNDDVIEDTRICSLCKASGDGPSDDTGRLIYCGQNEWVHGNCALWSGEVFEEIDGSLQNVHSAISRGRGIRCPHCQLRGASVGCCVRSCSETYHFPCARATGCVFLDDKSVYCRAHASESAGRLLQNEKDFELRRPVYVELDKRRSKPVEVCAVKLIVGGLHIESLGRFVPDFSDQPQSIIPADFCATRLFWSIREPWRLVKYRLSIRYLEPEQSEGVDLGVNLTIDHSRSDVEARLRQLRHFQLHHSLLPLEPPRPSKRLKRRILDPLDEPDNQDLIPPDIEEAILKELSHDMLEGISVQDLFQDIGDREREEEGGDEELVGHPRPRKTGTLRSGNWNAKFEKQEKGESKWKRKPQEGKENKMVAWCARLLQVDGAVDSSSGSEAGESPGRSVDIPADIPQLDGAEDSDYESCDGIPETDEAPVKCSVCHCTYRTQRSYERHFEGRCHDMLLSSSEEEEDVTPPPPPPAAKPPKPRTYSRKKPVPVPPPPSVPPTSAPSIIIPPSPVPVILQEVPAYQPMVQYIVEQQKPLMVPNAYQVVLPPSPVVLSTPSPMFEVVSDPITGGMYLTQPPTQPLLYNMETIVSNTVMQTNQFVSSSYSQTSTQVFQASKLEQVVNMPTSYVLAPNDLICLPVPQAIPASPVRTQWTPPKPKPMVVKQETPPRPAIPLMKPKPRSRALVDYINNFRSDAPDVPTSAPEWASTSTVPRRPPPVSAPVRRATPISSVRPMVAPMVQSPQRKRAVAPMVRPTATVTAVTTTLAPALRKPFSPQQTMLSISMPSLDDSPPASCDNSPVLFPSRQLTLPSSTHVSSTMSTLVCSSSSLSVPCVNTLPSVSPSQPNQPLITSPKVLSQTVPVHETLPVARPPPNRVTGSHVGLIPVNNPSSQTVLGPAVPYNASILNAQCASPVFRSTNITSPQAPVLPCPIVNNPPSPFLSPKNAVPSSPSSQCLPSFTPPLPPPSSIPSNQPFANSSVPTSPLSAPRLPLHDKIELIPPPPATTKPDPPLPIKEQLQQVFTKATSEESVLHPTCPPFQPIRSPPTSLLPVAQPQAVPPQITQPTPPESNKCLNVTQLSDQNKPCIKEMKLTPRRIEPEGGKMVFDVVADDGFRCSSTSLNDVYKKIYESVQEIRAAYRMPPLPMAPNNYEILGMNNHGLQHLLEQLPGVGYCKRYQAKYFKKPRSSEEELTPVKENATGCARSEGYTDRKEPDKFGWLASRHRKLPKFNESADDSVATNRRTNNLPMAMRYRQLRESSKQDMIVYRSKIHGMGLFCLREIEAGEMVIEYSGELIRSALTDKREKLYTERGIGCYMFRIDDHSVIDATMKGNAARFINHSCEPNCYSRVVDILGKKHIIIFALRRISVNEELTYDYKFPFEDVKISCHCQSKKCRKYLN